MAQGTLTKPAYVDKLTAALLRAMKGAEVDVEHVRGDRYRFVVVWKGFDAMGHPERQEMVWDLVEKNVSKADLLKVAMVLTLGVEDLPRE